MGLRRIFGLIVLLFLGLAVSASAETGQTQQAGPSGLTSAADPLPASSAPSPAPVVPESLVRVPPLPDILMKVTGLGPSWRVLESDHFLVFSDCSLRYHRVIAGLMEQFTLLVYPRFFTKPLPKITVYLINSGQDYADFMTARGHADVAEAYGVYMGDENTFYSHRYFKDGSESGVGTLFHETVHAFVRAEIGDREAPVWFNEGFASLFEQGRVVRGEWVYGNPNPWREKLYRPEFEAGRVPDLRTYFSMTPGEYYGRDRSRGNSSNTNYNTGRSLYLYLLTRLGEPVLQKFVRSVLNGMDGITAIETAAGKTLAEIETGWKENVRKVNFGATYLTYGSGPEALKTLEEGVKQFPGYGMLHLALAERYGSDQRPQDALREAEQALQDPLLISPQDAYRIIGWACWDTDQARSARAYQQAVDTQPWVDDVLESDLKNLAALRKALGDPAGEELLLKQLAELQKEDGQAGK